MKSNQLSFCETPKPTKKRKMYDIKNPAVDDVIERLIGVYYGFTCGDGDFSDVSYALEKAKKIGLFDPMMPHRFPHFMTRLIEEQQRWYSV